MTLHDYWGDDSDIEEKLELLEFMADKKEPVSELEDWQIEDRNIQQAEWRACHGLDS